jgi:hypothetical protein
MSPGGAGRNQPAIATLRAKLVDDALNSNNPMQYIQENQVAYDKLFGGQYYKVLSDLAETAGKLENKLFINTPLKTVQRTGFEEQTGVSPAGLVSVLRDRVASTTYKGINLLSRFYVNQIDNTTKEELGRFLTDPNAVMKVNEASLPDGSLGAKLELSEYNAQVYDDLDITAFSPVPNSGLPSVSYFSPLSAPTVTGYPSAALPNFSVTVFVPTTGRVTFGNLFFTTSATPTAGDWQLLTSASTANNQPVTNNTYYTYTNLTLNTGTYYFAYQVGNEISNSVISPISAAFVWTPVGTVGPTGPTGGGGDSVDIIFKRSATQPTTPAPSVGTPATWYSDVNSVPAGADPIWSSVGTNTGAGTVYTWQTPLLIEGQNGTDGLSVAELLIYIRATSTPATPTGGSYNFTTQTLTAPAGWYSYVPTGTDPVYTSRSVASVSGTTGTDTTLTWSSPTLSFQNGATGPTGASVTGPTGLAGLTALTAYKVQSQSAAAPTFTTPTSGATAPSGWSLSTPAITIGQVMWYIQGRYNSNGVTVDGVAAGTTAWTGPIAASVFQDIRSDNWNGSTPPTFGIPSSYGTTGYYIQQSTGDVFFNNGIFRANINTSGTGIFGGASSSGPGSYAVVANSGYGANGGVIGYSSAIFNGAVMGYGSGNAFGVYGSNSGSQAAVQGVNNVGGDAIFASIGRISTNNSTLVTNLNANYLDGYTRAAFATSNAGLAAYSAQRLDGSAGLNVMRFVKGTITGASTANFVATNKPGTSTTSNVWLEVTIDSTTVFIPVWT